MVGINVIRVGKGKHMRKGKERHFQTNEGVRQSHRDVLSIGVWPKLRNGACRDQDGYADRLPERKE